MENAARSMSQRLSTVIVAAYRLGSKGSLRVIERTGHALLCASTKYEVIGEVSIGLVRARCVFKSNANNCLTEITGVATLA